ncbi:MAG TPA: DUF4337 domain-containing protein [Myxococcales bacterium]|jgi:lipase chaperone LimK
MSEVEEVVENALEQREGAKSWLNTTAALTVAVVATFLALCNVKDDNIVQAMAQAQAGQVDTWAYYQAKSTKQTIAEATVDELKMQKELLGPAAAAAAVAILDRRIADYEGKARKYEAEKAEIKQHAEDLGHEYDRLNVRDDQFDMSEALLSVAIAVIGVSVLAEKKKLFAFALILAAAGLVLGVAGFASLSWHPDWLAKLLT